jgi:diguanylate cyclase (GGDEF)-like protein
MKKRTKAPAGGPGASARRHLAKNSAKNPAKNRAKSPARNPTETRGKISPARKPAEAGEHGSASAERARQTIRRLEAELAGARRRIKELQASAETDFLLGILNRRGFERELNRSIAYIKRYHASGAVIILDVDRLKPINDTFGHAAGDKVLKAVADTLDSVVRASDVLGRLGGDEFAVLIWNLNESDARAKALALEEAIDGLSFKFRGRTITVGASAGVAILGPRSDMRRTLAEADRAMYVRKAQRRHETKES